MFGAYMLIIYLVVSLLCIIYLNYLYVSFYIFIYSFIYLFIH
jgi:hypothetical protein